MNKEIEVKIQIDKEQIDKAKNWLNNHATYKGEIHHVEYYLNKPATTFFFYAPEGYKDAKDYLRIRMTKDGDFLCFKKFHMDPIEKRPLYCDEYEVQVSDGKQTLKLMHAIGYTDQTCMEKTRNTYTYDHFEIVIDEVKKLGFFMEIELKKNIKDPKTGIKMIYDYLQFIGINQFKLQMRGYVSMLWNPTYDFGQEVILS